MPDYVFTRVTALLNVERKAVNGSRVVLLGLAYKAGTGDWRESPSVEVASRLRAAGADVVFCDPHVDTGLAGSEVVLVDFDADTLAAADLVVVLVDHPRSTRRSSPSTHVSCSTRRTCSPACRSAARRSLTDTRRRTPRCRGHSHGR